MRKIWALSVAVFLITFLMVQGIFAEQGPITLVGEPRDGYQEEMMDSLCVMGDTLYLKGRNVYQWNPGDAQLTLFYKIYPPLEELQKSRDIPTFHGLVNFDSALMTLDFQNGVLCEVREDGLVPTQYKVNVRSFPNSTGDVDVDTGLIVYMFEAEERLFIVGQHSEGEYGTNRLYEVDIETGRITPVTKESEPILSAAPYKPGQLLIAISAQPQENSASIEGKAVRLCLWDMAENIYIEDSAFLIQQQAQKVSYDAGQDMIYIVTESEIYKVQWNGEPQLVNDMGRKYYDGIWEMPQLIGQSIAVCSSDGATVYSVDPSETSKRVLKIMLDINFDFDKPGKFSSQYPNVRVKMDYVAPTMIPALIASGEAPDVFVLNGLSNFDVLLDKGYAMDLSDDAELMQLVDQLYPQLQELILRDGGLRAFPADIRPGFWIYDTELFDELGLDVPQTYEELLDIYLLWEKEYAFEHSDKMIMYAYVNWKNELFDTALEQYVALNERKDAPLRFDTPEFRALVEMFDAVPFEYSTFDEMMNNPFNTNHVKPLIECVTNLYSLSPSRKVGFPPKLSKDSAPVAYTSVDLYAINPETKNRDIALEYIKFMVSEMQSDQWYMMNPSLNEPVESEYYKKQLAQIQKEYATEKNIQVDVSKQRDQDAYLAGLEHYISADLESQRWEIRAEHIEQYRALAPSMQLWNSSVLYNLDIAGELRRIISRHQEGQISLDQMIRELEQKTEMIYLENN